MLSFSPPRCQLFVWGLKLSCQSQVIFRACGAVGWDAPVSSRAFFFFFFLTWWALALPRGSLKAVTGPKWRLVIPVFLKKDLKEVKWILSISEYDLS